MRLNLYPKRFIILLFLSIFSFYYSIAQNNWSDPNTWPNGNVPSIGQDVMIPRDKTVVLDVSPPALGNLMVMGTLTFLDTDLNLTAATIKVDGGLLEIGTTKNPFTSKAVITLNGPIGTELHHNSRFLMPMNGGTIEFHGISANYLDWSQITASINPGDTSMILKDAPVGWKAGDKIVIASSAFDPREAEEVTVTSVNGSKVNFTPPLVYGHYGELQSYGGMELDERAEVGLLTRNIVLQGGADSEQLEKGGHVMVMPGSNARIEGTEFYHMGQLGEEARYAMHWHFAGDRPDNYIRNSSIHHSFHRGIVVHQTDNVTVEWNVAYDINSHTYVPSEDGVETGNKFYYNLGILTKRIAVEDFAFPKENNNRSTQSEHRPGTFWLKNPLNELVGNHAAGTLHGMGFFFDRRHTNHEIGKIINAITDPIVFKDNVAHSNYSNTGGNDVYGPLTKGYGIFGDNRAEGERIFENFTVYKNSLSGTWIEGPNIIIRNSISADNNTGHMLMQSSLENSVIVGQSANDLGGEAPKPGVYQRGGALQLVGHGGPKRPQVNNVQIFDQRHGAFISADKNALSNSYTQNLTLTNVEQPFWYRYSDANGAIEDRDGTLAGYGPSIIVSLESDLKTMQCIEKRDWRAYVCPFDTYNIIYFRKFDRNENEFPNLHLVSKKGKVDMIGANKGRGSSQGNKYNYIFKDTEFDVFNDLAWAKELEVSMELKPNTWDIIKMEAIAEDVQLLYGEERTPLTKQTSIENLKSVNVTSYFYDSNKKELFLKFSYEEEDILQVVNITHSGGIQPKNGTEVVPIGIYPNPVPNGNVNFEVPIRVKDNMLWALFDSTGRFVRTGKLEENQSELYLGNNSNGFYVLQFFEFGRLVAQAKLLVN